jgi:flavin reductase (DIM6/NTAB) family NADH-FMN oxidoreductase RutF
MEIKKEHYFLQTDLAGMEQRFRTHLINSIGGFKSLALIGSIDKAGQSNLAVFNSIVHLGAHPPLIGCIVRPDSVERHTLSNILEAGYYTINHVNEAIYKQAHQTSARYPKTQSEFEAVGLHEEYKNDFAAPFVKESSIQLGVMFKEKLDIVLNGTTLLVGEIVCIYYPEHCLLQDGHMDLEAAGSITCSGLDTYYGVKRLSRLSYAKPDTLPREVD